MRLLPPARLLSAAVLAIVALLAGEQGLVRAQTPEAAADGSGRRAAARTGGGARDRRRRHLGGDEPVPAVPRRARFPPSRRGRERPQRARSRTGSGGGDAKAAAGRATWWCACVSTPSAGWWTSACATACRRTTSPPPTIASRSSSRATVPSGAACTWTFGNGNAKPRTLDAGCSEAVMYRAALRPHRPWPSSTSRSPASRCAAPPARSPCAISSLPGSAIPSLPATAIRTARWRSPTKASASAASMRPCERRIFPPEPGRLQGRPRPAIPAAAKPTATNGRCCRRGGWAGPATAPSTAINCGRRSRSPSKARTWR